MLAMGDTGQHLPFRGTITLQLTGAHDAWDTLAPFEELVEERLRGRRISTTLHQDIGPSALLTYRSPQLMAFATDAEKPLVEMPLSARRGTSAA
jgi:hypothetical protein